jgi:DNA polymerase-3 subunit delta
MIITLTGKNDFLLQRRYDELTSEFLAAEGDLALERIDAAETSLNDITDAVASVPFLASRKMVVVKELSANKQAADNIEQIISATSPTTELVIVESSPDKRTAYFKNLKSDTQLEEYEDMEPAALAQWLVAEAKALAANLSPADANYLVDRVGTNQMQLFSELQKLATYNPEITRQSIDLLTDKTPQSKVFDLLDATFAGNKRRALELYSEQRAQNVEPQAIMALIAWQLQLIALAKYGQGKTAAQIAKEAKTSPYPVQKAQGLAAKLSRDKLDQMIHSALEIDYKSKSSALDLDEALKTYITTL